MKKIEGTISVEFEIAEIAEYNELVDKATEMDGLMLEDGDYKFNKCPKCGQYLVNDNSKYCRMCGQRVRFVDYSTVDVIPL